jgi:hypothetical protein
LVFRSSTSGQILEDHPARFKHHVEALCGNDLQGRASGSLGESLANQYIWENLNKGSKKKKLFYSFSVQGKTLKSTMVSAFIDRKSSKTVLIGAHIDHLGLGGELSKSPGKNKVHPGADDNASGVAMLIELHNYFTQNSSAYNLLFVAYTGHELGLHGSEHLSKHWQKRWKDLYQVFNFDMIGRMDTLKPKLIYSSNSDKNPLNPSKSFLLTKENSQRCETLDTKHFLSVPCYTFSTGNHSDYHKISDLPEYLNYQGLYEQFLFFRELLAR